MEYTVQRGDTIAQVTRLLGTDWQTLKQLNPDAVGKSSRNGNWFLREGRKVSVGQSFAGILNAQLSQNAHQAQVAKPETAETGGDQVHTVVSGDTIWELAVKRYHVDPDEMMKLNNISDPRLLQPGTELRIPAAADSGEESAIVASWYGQYHHGRTMANGQPYDMYGNTIAHKDIPLGTRVELENPRTGETVKAVVTDRGPYVDGRDVDLSYNLARRLSLVEQGVGRLIMRVL